MYSTFAPADAPPEPPATTVDDFTEMAAAVEVPFGSDAKNPT
ncbi:hypothetical protein V1286_005124 [Bradyrhizobium algeriense]|uniref:Uncharacterized protein n=1 Tax=Bradyrhizobium algeriense TaxID=634784 RepID=A0ABU8BGB7_9BRAD